METRMKDRCATCAFRKDTNANKDEITQAKVALCIEAGKPFYCHEEGCTEHLCAGFANALTKRVHAGDYNDEQVWKRELASTLLEQINQCEESGAFDVDAFKRDIIAVAGTLAAMEGE